MNQISGRLKEWTGENWMVALSEADGAETVADRETAERDSMFESAEQDPVVAAILKTFPKSKILDVRLPDNEDDTESLDESDALDAGLDNPDSEMPARDEQDPGAGDLDDYFNS